MPVICIFVDGFFFYLSLSLPLQDAQNPSNGSVADKAGGYDIGALATSSLMGETDTRLTWQGTGRACWEMK